MSSETNETADVVHRFQQEWKVSTEPVLWGYPQLLREVPYTFAGFDFDNDLLRIHCQESAAVLSIWSPREVTINEWGLRIADAQRVRWEWQYQGAAKTPPMLYFKEFWRTEEDVSGKSNAHWSAREVERRIDKGKAAVLWPGCLMERPAAKDPASEPRNAELKPEVLQKSGTALWRTRSSSLLNLLAFASLPLLWVYTFFSAVTQTGFMGYLFAFEVRSVGVANTALDLVLGLLASFVPCVLLGMAAEKLSMHAPRPVASSVVHKARTLPVLPTFLTLLVLGLTALYIHDRDLKLYSIDLSVPLSSTPRDAGFIELKAILAQGYRSGYYSCSGKSTHEHSYEPLVRPGWTPHDPIHYFMLSSSKANGFESLWRGRSRSMEVTSASPDSQNLAREFDARDLADFKGKVVGALPVIVRQDYEAKGFTLAPDYIVIERGYISGHKVSIWNRYDNLLITGFVLGILPLMSFIAPLFSGLSKAWSLLRNSSPAQLGAVALKKSIGIVTAGDVFSEIIAAGTPLPHTFSNSFGNASDNQTAVQITIAQKDASGTEKIVVATVNDLPERPKGKLTVVITVTVDKEKRLSLKATVPETGYLKQFDPLPVQ